MRTKAFPLSVLAAAVLALVGTIAFASARADGHHDGAMMGDFGPGMMGYDPGDREPVADLAAARRQAGRFADRLDLRVGEVMRFSNHYYAELVEDDGTPATEVLVDPGTGSVWLEYGPAMMWNTRYGMMSDFRLRSGGSMMDGGMMGMMGGSMMDGSSSGPGGMMGGDGMMGSGSMMDGTYPGFATADTEPVTGARAADIAAQWLDSTESGLTVGDPEQFPGYFTFHVLRDGRIVGMLSVNESTGAVWSHWWHGRYLSMLEA